MTRRRGLNGVPGDGRMEVTCWCEETIGLLAADELLAGRTFSCGRPGCEPVSRFA